MRRPPRACAAFLAAFLASATALALPQGAPKADAPATAKAEAPPAVRELAVRGFAFEHEIQLPGTPDEVFDAFTLETLAFWDHTFSKAPVRLSIEPRPGGAFTEVFDGAGNGARHAEVLTADRGRLLRFAGPLGLAGQPVEMVHTMTFAPGEPGKTKLRLEVRGTGAYADGIPAIVKGVWWHFLDEAFRPYLEARKDGLHPYVAAVEAYRAARDRKDVAALGSILAADARIWFEEKTGPGEPIQPAGEDPWSAWDAFFRSETTRSDARIRPGELRLTVHEINDWYRLVDRPESSYFMTYAFDASRRITSILVHGIPKRPKTSDRLDAFKAWARARRPGLLEKLMPEGKIDPALEKARLWKSALLAWRAEAGLPRVVD